MCRHRFRGRRTRRCSPKSRGRACHPYTVCKGLHIRSRLCEDLEPLVKEFERAIDCKFEILQVKGNFGGLRIHVSHANDAIRQRIEAAEQEPFRTCEVCRQRGIGGKAAGLRLCATSTPAHTEQEIMDYATHDQRLHFCIARSTWVAAA